MRWLGESSPEAHAAVLLSSGIADLPIWMPDPLTPSQRDGVGLLFMPVGTQ
jgi:hypothetical protein